MQRVLTTRHYARETNWEALMKNLNLCVALSAVALAAMPAFLHAGTPKRASAPVVITMPAVPNGRNFSRAPFPAARWENDVTPPNGVAFDLDLPPNTPSTTPDPIAPPVPRYAILQPAVPPGEMPTGLVAIGASTALDPARVEPTIRSAMYESRDDLIDSLRLRVRQGQTTIAELRRTQSQMSADGRAQFSAAMSEARDREKRLEKSLRSAARASSTSWDSARDQLAAAYDAYAASLAQIDAAAGIAPARW
jgi:hypothetical protein